MLLNHSTHIVCLIARFQNTGAGRPLGTGSDNSLGGRGGNIGESFLGRLDFEEPVIFSIDAQLIIYIMKLKMADKKQTLIVKCTNNILEQGWANYGPRALTEI